MNLTTLVRICGKYERLGSAITSQMDDMIRDCEPNELNANAVRYIREFLADVRDDLNKEGQHWVDELLSDYSEEIMMGPDVEEEDAA